MITYLLTIAISIQANALVHEMQHGFILSADDTFGSHLVAQGHHSRQAEIKGQLVIQNLNDRALYQQRKMASTINQTYFVFQAQQLDLPNVTEGMTLEGHIIESKIGGYEPRNIVVKIATYEVKKVLLNIINPFFTEDPKVLNGSSDSPRHADTSSKKLSPASKEEKLHCCDTGEKPCNWKC